MNVNQILRLLRPLLRRRGKTQKWALLAVGLVVGYSLLHPYLSRQFGWDLPRLDGRRNTATQVDASSEGEQAILSAFANKQSDVIVECELDVMKEIHHVMERMGDGNGIYIRGAGAGNVIRRNYIHHLVTPMQMQAAIRTDGGQRDTLIAENLIYKCMAQGIILKLNNRCENNIVADVLAPPRGFYLSLREGPMSDAVIKRNIFYANGKDTTFIDELPPGNRRRSEDRRGRALNAIYFGTGGSVLSLCFWSG